MDRQRTIKKTVKWKGVGIHSGNEVLMSLLPAPPGHGVAFSIKNTLIPARCENIAWGARNTSLTESGVTVHTVEHILAALYGTGVDNAVVSLTAPEPPVMDGSALPFVKSILDAGLKTQNAERRVIAPRACAAVESGGRHLFILPAEDLRITYFLEYDHPLLRRQVFNYEFDFETFTSRVAPARTYALIEEVEALREQGLAKGGSLENAVVFYRDSTSRPLRFPDEPARHKALDLIGDLSLLGGRLKGRVVSTGAGHALNQALVRKIAKGQELIPV